MLKTIILFFFYKKCMNLNKWFTREVIDDGISENFDIKSMALVQSFIAIVCQMENLLTLPPPINE